MKSAPTIAFDYQPSRLLIAALLAILACALIAIALAGLSLGVRLALACSALAYGFVALWKFSTPVWRQATWHAAGHWRLRDGSGQEASAQIRHAAVLGGILALTLRIEQRPDVHFLLLSDNSDAETRRRLRVRLARGTGVAA